MFICAANTIDAGRTAADTPGMFIRAETEADVPAITAVTVAAFETLAASQHTEQFIIAALASDGPLPQGTVMFHEGTSANWFLAVGRFCEAAVFAGILPVGRQVSPTHRVGLQQLASYRGAHDAFKATEGSIRP